MKFERNEKIKTIAIYSFLVLASVVLLVFLLINLGSIHAFFLNVLSIMTPVLGGIIMAYMLNPLLTLFENKVFRKVGKGKTYSKLRRGLSIVCVLLCVLLVLTLIIMILIPQIIESYNMFSEKFSNVDDVVGMITGYVKNNEVLSKYYDSVLRIIGIDPESGDSAIIEKAYEWIQDIIPIVADLITTVAGGVYNAVIAFVFAVYLLAYREKMHTLLTKLFKAFTNKKHYERIGEIYRITDYNFGNYIRNKLFDSLIVFLFSYIAYWALGLKFFPILAIISGITNFIPFFGPIFGSIPVVFIVLLTQPSKAIWVILIIIAIQQIDYRIIGPVLLGRLEKIPAVWVITSTIVFGALFGLLGMLFGVPLFATLYRIIGDKVNSRLKAKGLSPNTESYFPKSDDGGALKVTASPEKSKSDCNSENK